ncbi:hypothetical protein D3C86_2062270 [compost metagenome]
MTLPTIYGLIRPPSWPMELISAIPAAAAMPVRKRCGKPQNRPMAEISPVAAIVRPTSKAVVCSLYMPQMK